MPPKTNVDTNIVFEPVPGSASELAIDTRCHHTLYDGTRGAMKSATQLMRYRRRVGLGYGKFWRGAIFDKEFKNLGDLVAQSKKFFGAFNDGAKFLESGSDYKWVWPTGEELLFRHIKKDSDYQGFHGHEHCLFEDEEIITNKGNIAIKNIKVGDTVLTPTGYKKVNKVYDLGTKPCVKASIYTSGGRLHSEQRQSVNHHLLTSEGVFLIPPLHLCHNVPLFLGKTCFEEVNHTPQNDVCQEKKGVFFLSKCEEIFSKALGKNSQNDFLILFSVLFLTLQVILLRKCAVLFQLLSTLYYGFLKFFSLTAESRGVERAKHLGQKQILKLRLRHLDFLVSNLRVLRKDALFELRKAKDLKDRYLSYSRLYGELARIDKEIYRYSFLQLLGVQDTILEKPSGDSEDSLLYSLPSRLVFSHPYTGKPVCSNLLLSNGYCICVPCGDLRVYDIEVEDSNCYITHSGVINKNCFIGWNELTKWPTSSLYDKLMSTNRSSFIPEKHTPKVKTKTGWKYATPDGKPLPPIPLEVFSTTNPSGPGHNWVKKRFIDCAPCGEVVETIVNVFDPKTQKDIEVVRTQVRIFGSYRENIYLDAIYLANLNILTENDENLRRAWLFGDWNITAGGALDDLWDNRIHILPRFNIPDNWRVDRSFDWGQSKPFSVCWWAEANGEETVLPDGSTFCPVRGSLIQIAEWYGSKEIGTNKGINLGASDVADGIKNKEIELMAQGWILKQPVPGPADNAIAGGNDPQDDSTEKKMAKKGIRWTKSDKAKGSRVDGLTMVREMMANAKKKEGPAIYFMNNCKASIETLPPLPRDDDNLDDVDSDAEDHIYDAVRYRVLKGSNRMATKIKVVYPN